jgi:hypothetical protein
MTVANAPHAEIVYSPSNVFWRLDSAGRAAGIVFCRAGLFPWSLGYDGLRGGMLAHVLSGRRLTNSSLMFKLFAEVPDTNGHISKDIKPAPGVPK